MRSSIAFSSKPVTTWTSKHSLLRSLLRAVHSPIDRRHRDCFEFLYSRSVWFFLHFFFSFFWYTRKQNHLSVSVKPNIIMIRQPWEPSPHYTTYIQYANLLPFYKSITFLSSRKCTNGLDTVFTCMLWSLINITIIIMLVVVFKMSSVRNQTNDMDTMEAVAAQNWNLGLGRFLVFFFFFLVLFKFRLRTTSTRTCTQCRHFRPTHTRLLRMCDFEFRCTARKHKKSNEFWYKYFESNIGVHGEKSGGRYTADIDVRTKHS